MVTSLFIDEDGKQQNKIETYLLYSLPVTGVSMKLLLMSRNVGLQACSIHPS
jgi:hypothetical protein